MANEIRASMKIPEFIIFILVVSGIFFTFGMIVSETNSKFPNSTINASEWNESYDFATDLNSTLFPLEQKFKVLEDENEGFFTKLAAGISAIPYAVILLPRVLFNSIEIGGTISTGFLVALAIPGYIIMLFIIGILVWGLFKLLEFFQGSLT